MWHCIVTVLGEPYPTRTAAHPEPEGDNFEVLDLGPLLPEYIAVHEAAHAVVHLAGGAELLSVSAVDRLTLARYAGWEAGDSADSLVAASAAGERAGDRWLREQGLWTPHRAVANEVGAHHDRDVVLRYTGAHFGIGSGPDYLLVHDLADAALDRRWRQVLAVASALLEHDTLTGAQVAEILRSGEVA